MTYVPLSMYHQDDRTGHKRKPKRAWTKKTVGKAKQVKELTARFGRKLSDAEIRKIELDRMTPETRGDCPNTRPCPHLACQYHLRYDLNDKGGEVTNHPDVEWYELDVTCALDMADSGETTLGTIGSLMGITRERVRQIETNAIEKLRANDDAADLFLMLGGKR